MSKVKLLVLVACVVVLVGAGATMLKRAQNRSNKTEFTSQEWEQYDKAKAAAMEKVLGPMDDIVGHAVIPYATGGTVDMYYYTKGIPGTGMATMELIQPDGKGARANRIGTYELVAFTRNTRAEGYKPGDKSAFDKIERRMCGVFTSLGHYGMLEIVNPEETAEMPVDDNNDICWLIFDEYKGPSGEDFVINGKRHCLLLCIEVFKSECKWAMKNGGKELIGKLKAAGYYPYSDLDRKPVE